MVTPITYNKVKIFESMENQEEFICQFCGKIYNNINSLKPHERQCTKNENRIIHNWNTNPRKKEGGWNSWCGQNFLTRRLLQLHRKECEICKIEHNFPWNKGLTSWNKGLTKDTDERVKKGIETLRARYLAKEIQPSFLGKHHTEEAKEKIRNAFNHRNGYRVNYNKEACSFIDDLNEMFNWKLQHAENGGEVIIGGYYLDGYDKELNIAFEYDEKKHYDNVDENILCQHDYKRMCFIHTKSNCRFFRYNEKLNLLYEVTNFDKVYEIKTNSDKCHKIISPEEIEKNKSILEMHRHEGKLDKNGKYVKSMISNIEWERRKNLLLNAKTDMTKFGWVGKMEKEINESKQIIEETLEHFPEIFEGKFFRRNRK